jgi:hypothetical protein
MRTLLAAAALMIGASGTLAGEASWDAGSSAPASDYVGGLGNVTGFGLTGLFQNPTSGILPEGALLVQDCFGIAQTVGDNFQTNGLLVSYGVNDWLEVGGFFASAFGLDPARVGDSDFYAGQAQARVRLVRDEGIMPEISVAGVAGFGDDAISKHSMLLMASKGVSLAEGDIMRSARLHSGVRHDWRGVGIEVTTAFIGLEVEAFRNIFLIGDVNTKDDSFIKTPWSAGVQYRDKGFGLSLAIVQDGNRTDETYFIGIGVSY